MIVKTCKLEDLPTASSGPRAVLVPTTEGDDSYVELKLTAGEAAGLVVGREYAVKLVEVAVDPQEEVAPAAPAEVVEPPAAPDPPAGTPPDLADLTHAELQAECERLGIAKAGNKKELVERINEHLADTGE